jgi:hypothetical protein
MKTRPEDQTRRSGPPPGGMLVSAPSYGVGMGLRSPGEAASRAPRPRALGSGRAAPRYPRAPQGRFVSKSEAPVSWDQQRRARGSQLGGARRFLCINLPILLSCWHHSSVACQVCSWVRSRVHMMCELVVSIACSGRVVADLQRGTKYYLLSTECRVHLVHLQWQYLAGFGR